MDNKCAFSERPVQRLSRSLRPPGGLRADPRRSRHALRRVAPTLLAARRRSGGLNGLADGHPNHGRGPGCVSRWQWPGGPVGTTLLSSRHLAGIRPDTAARHSLLLPCLDLRCGRQDTGDAGRAAREHDQRPALPGRLPHARARRVDLRVYGASQHAAHIPLVRLLQYAGTLYCDGSSVFAGLQLASDAGQHHGPVSHRPSAFDSGQHWVLRLLGPAW